MSQEDIIDVIGLILNFYDDLPQTRTNMISLSNGKLLNNDMLIKRRQLC